MTLLRPADTVQTTGVDKLGGPATLPTWCTVTPDTAGEVLADCDSVHGYVERVCFKTGPPGLVGAELEWLVAFHADPTTVVPLTDLSDVLASVPALPNGTTITFEPGGQLELSSSPQPGAGACWRSLGEDLHLVRTALAEAGLVLLPTAVDPYRPPRRQLKHPRYDAMEAYFHNIGAPDGAVMMNSTAAVQVNLDIGADTTDASRRWDLLNALGPVMVAAFANSPVHAGRRTGWKSTRQRVWQHLDPQRTSPPTGEGTAARWADYALDARLMLRRSDDEDWTVEPGTTFRDWVTGRNGSARPTEDDLEYHLGTLFPPVRPRGWFEVRYIDAQPPDLWPVPMAVLTALLDDPDAGHESGAHAEPVADSWEAAAREGLDDPALAKAAVGCFEAASSALRRNGTEPALVALVEQFAETYVRRGRCPADDTNHLVPESR